MIENREARKLRWGTIGLVRLSYRGTPLFLGWVTLFEPHNTIDQIPWQSIHGATEVGEGLHQCCGDAVESVRGSTEALAGLRTESQFLKWVIRDEHQLINLIMAPRVLIYSEGELVLSVLWSYVIEQADLCIYDVDSRGLESNPVQDSPSRDIRLDHFRVVLYKTNGHKLARLSLLSALRT